MIPGLQTSLVAIRFLRVSTSNTVSSHCRCVYSKVPKFNHGHHYQFQSVSKFLALGVVPFMYYLYRKRNEILPVVQAASLTSLRSQHNFIADVVEKAAGAVVCIELKDAQRLDFFTWAPQAMSNGSGFIVDENGLIVTNAHVVLAHPQSVIQVKLADNTVYPAYVEHIDVHTDLALLRIKAKKKLPTLKLGTSKDLRPGEFVIAMGSPLSLTNTVTSGIVSSPCRKSSELNLHGKDMSYIQTDAAITFGNSGGPLINLDGEVVGINAMRLAQSGGISFAIPVDYVKNFLEQGKNKSGPTKVPGFGKRYLGLTMMTLKPEVIREMHLRYHYVPPEITQGALVWKVVVGSPAYKGGLVPGDIVIEINGSQVVSSDTIYDALDQYTVLTMKIFRGDRYYEVVIHPEEVL